MRLDRGWKYPDESEKPRHICPYCGSYGYMMTDEMYIGQPQDHCCEVCNSTWRESLHEWISIQASGPIKEA